jgi:hypothetical protein
MAVMDRKQFMAQVWSRLELFRVGLDRLRMLALQADDAVRMLYHARVMELLSRYAALKGGALELEKVSDDAWPKLSCSVERASRDFDQSLSEALSQRK